MLLSALDVGLLVVYVFISAAVGLYSARQASTGPVSREGYFLAGRTANRWTTGISLLSGLSSGISFLGIPGFAFGHGIMQMWQVLSFILVTMAVAVMTVPFFQRGGFVTSYAYLEARFSVSIRTAAAVAFVLRIAFYLALVLYAPALAVSAVAGLSIYVSITLCGVLATLYTMKGGMTAVIATDFMQSLTLIFGTLLCLGLALNGVHGDRSVWEIMRERGSNATALAYATAHSDDDDAQYYPGPGAGWHPYNKQDVWSMAFGYVFNGLGQNGVDQVAVQRYLATPDPSVPVVLGGLLNALSLAALSALGVAMFGFYFSRGAPALAALPSKADQVFPYFFTHDVPNGVGGILTAALFGTTMSVMSGGLNAAATSIIVDLCQRALGIGRDATDAQVVHASRIVTLALGMLAIVLAFLAQLIGQSLVLMSAAVQGVFCGPTLGVFLLGMCSTRANSQGALCGYVSGFCVLLACIVGQAVCSSRSADDKACAAGGSLHVLRLSEWWYGAIGCLVTGPVGYVCSFMWPAPAPAVLAGLTFATQHDKCKHPGEMVHREPLLK